MAALVLPDSPSDPVRLGVLSVIAISIVYVFVDSLRGSSDNSSVDRREQTRTLWFWFGLLVVAACSSQALCQDPHDYVPNLPYTAQAVRTSFETSEDGTRVRREDGVVQMRDSQGRTRIEVFQDEDSNCCNRGKPDWVNLYIPLRREFIQLFPGKTASVMTYSVPVPTHGQKVGKTMTESLGGRLINGIYAEGARITQVIPSDGGHGSAIVYVEEEWISPDLKIIVLAKGTSSTNPGEETTTEIRELDRSEPNPALFEIPTDYKVVKVQ
jgi:hypothetical protein